MVVDYNRELLVLHTCRRPHEDNVTEKGQSLSLPPRYHAFYYHGFRSFRGEPAGGDFMFLPYKQTSNRIGAGGGISSTRISMPFK